MNPLTFAPLMLALAGALGAPFVVRALRPQRACQALSAIAVAAVVSTIAALALIVVAAVDGGFAHQVAEPAGDSSLIARVLEFCGGLYDHRAPMWAGLAAAAVLTYAGVRVVRSELRWRRAVAPWRDAAPIEVVPGSGTDAFAVPGRPGAIIVGQGLFDALDRRERRVVLAHERAHLDSGHHRYLRIADAAASFPFLAPIAGQIRFATERQADEVAAESIGDRRLVARAIIKAALISTGSAATPLPAAAAGHVTARVDALLRETTTSAARHGAVPASLFPLTVTLVAAAVQLHHLGVFVTHASSGHI